MFELPLAPHLVFKEYRAPVARRHLDDLVAWMERAGSSSPVRAAAAWPAAVVTDAAATARLGVPAAVGLLVPRAPYRFSVRHRDGTTRLATLSYLTADPQQRSAAYGLDLPPRAGPDRLGLVYALARLLEAFEAGPPAIGHGDLSTKNVLWSLQRGPEVFVLDCDNCELYGEEGDPLGPPGRQRAMTPNWDDPAVAPRTNATQATDGYSLALIFLRVVGAAHFPLQARQREGDAVSIDFEVPSRYDGSELLGAGAPVWELCRRGLSVSDPPCRPRADEWVVGLEGLLGRMGATAVVRAVWAAQGGAPTGQGTVPRGTVPGGTQARPPAAARDAGVTIRLVAARARVAPPPRRLAAPVSSLAPAGVAPVWSGRGTRLAPPAQPPPPAPLLAPVRASAGMALRWWLGQHRRMLRAVLGPRRWGEGLRRLVFCVMVDLTAAAVSLFVVAMIVSPFLGI